MTLQWSWERRDRHLWATVVGTAGLGAATAMAAFGLPPVQLHGVHHYLGIMDALCGGTRAAASTAQGDWAQAWRYNPLGIVAVLAASAAALRALVGVLAGRWLTLAVALTPRQARALAVIAVAVFVALTVRQQLRADLLMAGAA